MADTKISELQTLAESPANNDVYAIVDITAGATKQITSAYARRDAFNAITVTGSLSLNVKHFVTLSAASAIALTISSTPSAGDEIEIIRDGADAVTHTVVLPVGVTWDGTNRTANFDAADDRIRAKAVSATRFRILENDNVTFTA